MRPLPELPETTWLELEILALLQERERYGNELLGFLNRHLGEDSISSGKLYPNLKKLEKAGLIKRLKKKQKKKDMENKIKTGFLTRGVDRVYFELTEEGEEEIRKAESYMTALQFNRMMDKINHRVSDHLREILSSLGRELSVGVACFPNEEGFIRAMEMVPNIPGVRYFYLLVSPKGSDEPKIDMENFGRNIAHFPAGYDDIPLRSNYLDAMISTAYLSEADNKRQYLSELVRTIKPGGKVILVEYARLDSFILEDMFKMHIPLAEGREYLGEDLDEMAAILEELLKKVEIWRFKELFIAHGRKADDIIF